MNLTGHGAGMLMSFEPPSTQSMSSRTVDDVKKDIQANLGVVDRPTMEVPAQQNLRPHSRQEFELDRNNTANFSPVVPTSNLNGLIHDIASDVQNRQQLSQGQSFLNGSFAEARPSVDSLLNTRANEGSVVSSVDSYRTVNIAGKQLLFSFNWLIV